MELELELDQLVDKKIASSRNFCPVCKESFFGKKCPRCGKSGNIEHFEDPDFDEYLDAVEEMNEEFFKKLQWKEVEENEELEDAESS